MEEEFERLRSRLDEEDRKREVILKKSRLIIRYCSDSIKMLHRGDIPGAQERLEQVRELFNQVDTATYRSTTTNTRGILQTPYQEYAEAIFFLNFLEQRKILSITDEIFVEVGMPDYCYALGLCDFAGELGRMFLDVLRTGNIEEENKVFDFLQDLYSNLIALDYPNGLIPGLKRKTDVVRFVLEKARNTLTQAVVSRPTRK